MRIGWRPFGGQGTDRQCGEDNAETSDLELGVHAFLTSFVPRQARTEQTRWNADGSHRSSIATRATYIDLRASSAPAASAASFA